MRKIFRRHKKESAEEASSSRAIGTDEPSLSLVATPAGQHVCTSLCDGLAAMPPEYHESIIASMTEGLGETPTNLKVNNLSLSLSNIQIVGQSREEGSIEARREIEGNTSMSKIPLALPPTFEYPPLPKGHARFLRQMGRATHPMGSLESHSLASPPEYTAISYCWDPTSKERSMFLCDKRTPHLNRSFTISETVLQVLNQMPSNALVWIDQICIDQKNGDEKLDQIFRMGEIYSKASKVFIWLGPTANQSDTALANMEGMLNQVANLNDVTARNEDIPHDLASAVNNNSGQMYGHLFSRPWFRRLWTVQEALLARQLVVMCGYREVDFGLLVDLAYQILLYGSMDLIQLPGVSTDTLNDAIVGLLSLDGLRPQDTSVRALTEGFNYHRFRMLVVESRNRKVTMNADRVHAVMGVAPQSIRNQMAAAQKQNSKQTEAHLYANFAVIMLEHDPQWLFLSQAPSEERMPGLPSWVPSLDSRPRYASRFSDRGFLAGISDATSCLIKRRITPTELHANGFRVATITDLVPQTAFPQERQNMKHNEICDEATDKWHSAALQLCQKTYGLGPDQFPQFQVTILHAASRARPAMGGDGLAGYHLFHEACKVRAEIERLVRLGDFVVPPKWARYPNGTALFINHAVNSWRKKLSVQNYQRLVDFCTDIVSSCAGRPYIATDQKLVGLGCPGVRIGDVVVVLYGCPVPFILRPRRDRTMELVGDCYVHGLMNGEELSRDRNDEMFTIT